MTTEEISVQRAERAPIEQVGVIGQAPTGWIIVGWKFGGGGPTPMLDLERQRLCGWPFAELQALASASGR